ncbi:MAG: alpha/beta fold hydrolase [Thermoplasmata archaeon]
MTAARRDLHLGDGRAVCVEEDGDLRGMPVFVLHGTPGSRLLYAEHAADAKRRGIRLIGHDRPGYGGSTRKPGRTIADAAGDVRAIADALGLDRFAVWGHSGGGAPALACAALLPDRVIAAASLAGTAPYPAAGLDWTAGMGEANREDMALMLDDRGAWEAKAIAEAAQMRSGTVEQLLEMLATLLSDVDRAVLTPGLATYLDAEAKAGIDPGAAGVIDDNLSGVLPWGFDLSAIRVPLQLWHGGEDRFVPFAHGQWLAERLPRAELHLDPNEGHLSLFANRIPEVQKWLASHT